MSSSLPSTVLHGAVCVTWVDAHLGAQLTHQLHTGVRRQPASTRHLLRDAGRGAAHRHRPSESDAGLAQGLAPLLWSGRPLVQQVHRLLQNQGLDGVEAAVGLGWLGCCPARPLGAGAAASLARRTAAGQRPPPAVAEAASAPRRMAAETQQLRLALTWGWIPWHV